MASRTKHGLLVARGLLTALVFQGLYFPQCVGQADRVGYQFDLEAPEKLKELDANMEDLFKSRTEVFKMNWCEANQDRCPKGEFPTEGLEAKVVKNHSAEYDASPPPSDKEDPDNEWSRCTKMGPLTAERTGDKYRFRRTGDNNRCCQTWNLWVLMRGWTNTWNGALYHIPSLGKTYQYVSIGDCYGDSKGACSIKQVNGQCCQKKRPVTLLCREVNTHSYAFRRFDMLAYCSCQSSC